VRLKPIDDVVSVPILKEQSEEQKT
jgi:hypothetical protein